MTILQNRFAPGMLHGTGDFGIDEAATNLLRSLQALNDDESEYGESRVGSPMAYSGATSPMSASSVATPMSRRQRAFGSSRSLYHSASTPTLSSRNADPTVCRTRGERLRNVGQSMMCQEPRQSPNGRYDAASWTRSPQAASGDLNSFRQQRSQRYSERSVTIVDTPKDDSSRQHRSEEKQTLRAAHEKMLESAALHEKMREELTSVKQQLSWAQSELQRRAPVAIQEDKREELQDQITDLKAKLSKANAERDRYKAEAQTAKKQNQISSEAQEELASLRAMLNEAKAENAKLKENLSKSTDEVQANTKPVDDQVSNQLKAENEQLKHDLSVARKQASHVSEEIKIHVRKLQKDLKSAQEQLPQKDSMLQKLQSDIQTSQELLGSKDKNLKEVQRELRSVMGQLREEKAKAGLPQSPEEKRRSLSEVGVFDFADPAALDECWRAVTPKAKAHRRAYASHMRGLEREKMTLQQALSDYSSFTAQMVKSSSRAVLDGAVDMNSSELLGTGKFGYVMACTSRSTNEKVILKLQGVRWLDEAVMEWMHGKEVGNHPNIVEQREFLLHSDSDQAIQDRITSRFSGAGFALSGQRPRQMADTYVCAVTEYMDRGSVASWMEKELWTLEGVCAVTCQVASALAFMHQKHRSHLDVRPSTILLRTTPERNVLGVKLADVGSAAPFENASQDSELLAYTCWSMVLGRPFSQCPQREERSDAMEEFQKAKMLGSTATARSTALIEVVSGLWSEQPNLTFVAERPELLDCHVKDPEDSEMRRHLLACAKSEVTQRANQSLKRFHHVSFQSDKSGRVRRRSSSLTSVEEGAVPVHDTRD